MVVSTKPSIIHENCLCIYHNDQQQFIFPQYGITLWDTVIGLSQKPHAQLWKIVFNCWVYLINKTKIWKYELKHNQNNSSKDIVFPLKMKTIVSHNGIFQNFLPKAPPNKLPFCNSVCVNVAIRTSWETSNLHWQFCIV